MTTTSQQTPNPALDFADAILEDTNNGLELIEILHDIAQGNDQNATTNDRIAAATILADRGFGKAPKQIDPNPAPTPKSDANDANDVGAIRESPSVPAANPRPVTQIKDTLDQALGPAPTADSPLKTKNSLLKTIQTHILEITNNGQTIREALEEIARSEDYPRVTPYHRVRAVRILIDRILGTGRALTRPEPAEETPQPPKVRYVDPVKVAEARAELQRMKDEGELTPDPNLPKLDHSRYLNVTDEQVAPYAKEEAAKFWEEIDLRYERQKQWPEIEERRRRKHKEIYPSHSDDHEDDDKPPDP